MNNLAFFHVENIGAEIFLADLKLTCVHGTKELFIACNDDIIGKVSDIYGEQHVVLEHLDAGDTKIRKVLSLSQKVSLFSISSW